MTIIVINDRKLLIFPGDISIAHEVNAKLLRDLAIFDGINGQFFAVFLIADRVNLIADRVKLIIFVNVSIADDDNSVTFAIGGSSLNIIVIADSRRCYRYRSQTSRVIQR